MMSTITKGFLAACVIMACSAFTATVQAATATAGGNDSEIAGILGEAQDAYQKGYYKLSSTRLHQALNLIRQLETRRVQKIFPAPLDGWETSDGNDALNKFKSMGIGSVFATGLTYRHADQTVQLVLVQKPSTPQPLFDMLLAGLMMPRPGMEKIPVGEYTAHYLCAKSKPADCDISIPVGVDYVIMLNGKSASRDALLAYARAIRFDLLKEFR